MEFTIINIFGAIIEYFAIYAFLWIFFKPHPQRLAWRRSCHIVVPILFFLLSSFVDIAYLRPLLYIICASLIAIGFCGHLGIRIFLIVVFQIILVLLEVGISLFLSTLKDISYETFYLAGNTFVKLATLGVIATIFLFSKKRTLVFSQIERKQFILLLIFSSMSLILVLFSQYLLLIIDHPQLYIGGCCCILLCLGSNVGLYYLYYHLATGAEAKRHLQLLDFYVSHQKEYNNQLEQTYSEIRRISHDIKYYLSAISDLLKHNQIEEAKIELQKQEEKIEHVYVIDTGYSILNSLLTYKMQQAQQKRIQTQLFWNISDPLKINITELSVLLANGIDNAIEAASQVTETIPFISIMSEQVGNYIKIRICNNTEFEPQVVDGKIATTKANKEMHGLGLENIQILCERYDGQSTFMCEDYLATLTMILKNEMDSDKGTE